MFKQTSVTRRVAALMVIAALVTVTAACDPGVVGRACTGGFARDSSHVLGCKDGRWARLMTFSQYIAMTRGEHVKIEHDPTGSLDSVSGGVNSITASGWARDPDGGPIGVHVYVDDKWGKPTTASLSRPDVARALGGSPKSGFKLTVAVPPGPHRVCAYAINLPGSYGRNTLLACRWVDARTDAPADPLPLSATWLQTLNYHRKASGLDPVANNAAWSAGIVKHLKYLRDTPNSYFTGEYANAHTENPASPFYTPDGDQAGRSSNLGGGYSQRSSIEGWLGAPFHAIGILRPDLKQSAYGELNGSAGLDVIRGLDSGSTEPITQPILYPGNGAVVGIRSLSGESPNPLDSCPGFSYPAGLPIIALLPKNPPLSGVKASLTLPGGVAVPSRDLCVVTEHSYRSNDPVYGPTGKSIMDGDNAVLIIPRSPLTPGTHRVSLTVPGQGTWAWSFAEAR